MDRGRLQELIDAGEVVVQERKRTGVVKLPVIHLTKPVRLEGLFQEYKRLSSTPASGEKGCS